MASAEDKAYFLKSIDFLGRKVPILLQNLNGPCPLLAICNTLLLRNQLHIHQDLPSIEQADLVNLVASRLIEVNPGAEGESQAMALNRQKNLDDAISLLSVLERGLDVNVQFMNSPGSTAPPCTGFEYTKEFSPFDLLDMELVHGWLADPQDDHSRRALAGVTYNKAVEKVINSRGPVAGPEAGPEAAEAAEPPAQGAPAQETELAPKAAEAAEAVSAQGDGDAPPRTSGADESTCKRGAASGAAAEAPGPPTSAGGQGTEAGTEAASAAGTATAGEKTAKTSAVPGLKSRATGASEQEVLDGLVVDRFLTETSGQLTYHGLVELHAHLKDRQVAVFFRNNHFSTLFKYEGKLWTLVTDEGYRHEPAVVWERLDEIDGDTEYYTSRFEPLSSVAPPGPSLDLPANLVDPDYLLALAMSNTDTDHHTASPSPHVVATALPGALPGAIAVVDSAQIIAAAQNVHVVAPPPPSGYPPPAAGASAAGASAAGGSAVDDAAMARELERQLNAPPPEQAGSDDALDDAAYARLLHEQLEAEAEAEARLEQSQQQQRQQQQQQQQQHPRGHHQPSKATKGSKGKSSDCSIH
eukprot:CAMPEP_0172605436 /NCGR_PEP_ID=MMETSP1068-20121228/25673_1 /TAXON_ID=35684 /ORGANISM="Pseudopedinella elastica, Strain CCMP716" /LENGTH=583 /DNA_ID=CAMNT_0013407845 /DNA_START=116 /DNA_END=1867 /DNA_ORIENTATION=+